MFIKWWGDNTSLISVLWLKFIGQVSISIYFSIFSLCEYWKDGESRGCSGAQSGMLRKKCVRDLYHDFLETKPSKEWLKDLCMFSLEKRKWSGVMISIFKDCKGFTWKREPPCLLQFKKIGPEPIDSNCKIIIFFILFVRMFWLNIRENLLTLRARRQWKRKRTH